MFRLAHVTDPHFRGWGGARPGEFFGTGTFPSGAGIEYAKFQLRIGDVVRLEINGIGSVENNIVAEE